MSYLDRLTLYGKPIRVSISKHGAVQMPKEGQPDSGLTKDFANSSLHRFKKPESKNFQNIYPPSATLHLSNIPGTVDEERINEIFVDNGNENILLIKFLMHLHAPSRKSRIYNGMCLLSFLQAFPWLLSSSSRKLKIAIHIIEMMGQ